MASGHVNRTNRPNTWLHRPSLRREKSPCQLGAVHTWPIPTVSLWCECLDASEGEADIPQWQHARSGAKYPTFQDETGSNPMCRATSAARRGM